MSRLFAPLAVALVATLAVPSAARADDAPPGLAPQQVDDSPCGGPWRHHRPRLAIGVARGHLALDGDRTGDVSSLLGRVVLRHGFELELELARTELDRDVARTAGGAVLHGFGQHRLVPYVIAGGGGGRVERPDGSTSRIHFGELGGGVMLRKRHLALGLDVRAGIRRVDAADPADAAARMTVPATTDHEHYLRCRVIGLVYF